MNFDRFLQEAALLEGLAWRKYRRRSARRRVEHRLMELGLDGFDAYLELLRSDPKETSGLADLMRVTVSRFFREREQWRILADKVLPELIAENIGVDVIRAWSAGCCGGEEPYTLAIVWLESIAPFHPGSAIEILASDIDEASLERACAASYDMGSLREVPPDTLAHYLTREKGHWSLAGEVKGLVRLERRNVMSDPLPAGMDLVLCRYLAFTYYRGERLHAATVRLWETLRPGGILMVGKKERLPGGASAFFDPWSGCDGFYRRKG
ncbi:MAG: chemotaxis protein methyltransferase [Geobacteraceae bacterium]|nr:MAG: chemotaxis protein methyltransferase [Geobacteraceae bacterium]